MDEYISRNELLKVGQSNVAEAHNERCAQLLEAILNAPAADVVLKSEYDILKSLITHKEEEAYNKGYEDGKADNVSEIFAEIEMIMLDGEIGGKYAAKVINPDKYAELKKKYTEGEDRPATEEKYFSPEGVSKMTPQEVREKYTAIRRSMERW